MGDKNLTVTVTRVSDNEDGVSPPYTYSFSGEGKGSVNSTTGLIDFAGEGKNKYEVTFEIGSPFASSNSTVSFAETNPIVISVPANLFSDIARGSDNNQQASMTDNDDDEDVQGYEYTLNFDDGTSLDPRVVNRN